MLEEDAIIEWHKSAHSTRGQTEFLSQMEKMVHWLENAEEGSCLFGFLRVPATPFDMKT